MLLLWLTWPTIYFLVLKFHITLSGCVQHTFLGNKSYTCTGFPLKQIFLAPFYRPSILIANFYDCKDVFIPENVAFLVNLKKFTISCNTIERIHDNAFSNLLQLRELDLGSNSITTLPDKLFIPTNIQKFNLTSNKLTELSHKPYESLRNLQELHLSFNRISQLHPQALYSTSELRGLHLKYNAITIIPTKFFDFTEKLITIDLSHNNIKIITDVFQTTRLLQFLNLSHNAIENLSPGIFKNTRLETLDLSHNNLMVLHKESLQLTTLRNLYLQNNKISQMNMAGSSPTGISLHYLDVSRNRLVVLEPEFIKSAQNLVIFKADENPWDCKCYVNMQKLRGSLPLIQFSSEQHEGYLPLCVIGVQDDNDCDARKLNLTDYYSVFGEAFD